MTANLHGDAEGLTKPTCDFDRDLRMHEDRADHGEVSWRVIKANGFAKEIAILLARSRGASVGTTPEGMFDLPFCAMTQKTQSITFSLSPGEAMQIGTRSAHSHVSYSSHVQYSLGMKTGLTVPMKAADAAQRLADAQVPARARWDVRPRPMTDAERHRGAGGGAACSRPLPTAAARSHAETIPREGPPE